jgi:CHAT domain-containing protein
MTRRYNSNGGSIAKWLEERRLEARLRVLLIVNPTEDLEGAEAEGARLQEAFKKDGRVELTVLRGLEASKARVLQELSGGRHDLMHYAGHAHFLPGQPGRAGLLCAQAEELTGNDLRTVGALPALIFLNACESGRIRKRGKKKRNEPLIVMERLLQETSVAETLLQGGVGNLLATYWPVGDAGAEKFATSFYQGILTGATLGQSLVEARRVLAQGGLSDWADYMLFGSANFKLKISE